MYTTWIERPRSNLNDYAHHQFAGLLSNYYARRWEAFFADPDHADAALDTLEASAPSAAWTMPPRGGDLLKLASAALALGVLCTAEENAGAPVPARYVRPGATDASNCQMLCKTHNRAKGNR